MAKRIFPIVLAALVLGALLAWSQWRPVTQKVSGVIEADEIRLGSRVGGRVQDVHVEEGDLVEKNQPLVRLDEFDLLLRLAEAKALVQQRQAEFDKLNSGFRKEEIAQAEARHRQLVAKVARTERDPRIEEVKAAQAQTRLAKAQLEQSQQALRRLQDLAKKTPGAVSLDDLERAEEGMKVALANVEVREQELQILLLGAREEERNEARAERDSALAALDLAKSGYRQEEKTQAEAALAAARAQVGVVEKQLEELVITASIDGVVEALELQPGDLVSPGAPIMSLMDTQRLWVRAYVPQSRLDIRTGKKLKVTVDAYPGREFAGVVTFVSRQAEVTPSNVQTYDERAKQVFRIKVTLAQPDDKEVRLYPGMTANVYLGD